MHDSSIPTSKLITTTLWTTAVLLLGAAWSAWGLNGQADDLGLMIAFTGCVVTGAACVSSVRCYSLRLSRIIRATSTVRERESGELHAIP